MDQVLLVYDIENDKARTKIASTCQDYGLDRIQYSAFAGQLSRNHQQELMFKIKKLIREGKAKVQLVSISTKDWQNRMEIEENVRE
jgi:CRISPR-associated protein Cas2